MAKFKSDNYIHIPYEILGNRSLSHLSKLIYGLVQGFWEGQFTASNEYIAKTLGVSSRQVQRAILQLKEHKFIYATLVLKNNKVVGRVMKINKPNKKKNNEEQEDW